MNLKSLYEKKLETNVKRFLDVLDNFTSTEPIVYQDKDFKSKDDQLVTRTDVDDTVEDQDITIDGDLHVHGPTKIPTTEQMEELIRNTLFPSADVIADGIKSQAARRLEDPVDDYGYQPNHFTGNTASQAKEERAEKIEDVKTQAIVDSMLNRAETIYESEPIKALITWEQFSQHMENIGEIIDDDFDTILCITRGGLIPAGMMSYQLGIKDVVNIKISSYEGTTQGELSIEKLSKKEIKKLKNAKNILVVDDIVDTGDTLGELFDYLYNDVDPDVGDKCSVFSVVTKNPTYNDYFIYNMEDRKEWVVFPWDK